MRVVLISLERWDEVWRRNQHFATQLVAQGLAEHVSFVEPPLLGYRRWETQGVAPGLDVVKPSLVIPKRAGGLAVAGRMLGKAFVRQADVLWVNDPTFGVHCQTWGVPTVYDVTDDWRVFDFPPRVRRRLIRAEDRLARSARTVVCSAVLRDRWRERYGVDADVVNNGVDTEAWNRAAPRELPGPAPHVGYVGTLHEERLDVDLVLRVAEEDSIGQVHLVGPDALSESARARLVAQPKIRLHGAVRSAEVAGWTKAMDVLLCPHVITPFTLSLDAIKSYEYLASGRPIVATPTSGFQAVTADGLTLADKENYPRAVTEALMGHLVHRDLIDVDWSSRARSFARLLQRTGPSTANASP